MQEFNPILVLVVVAVSVLSGAGSFLQQRRTQRRNREWWFMELFSELVIACTAGLAALFLGLWQEFSSPLTCLIALIAASNGALFMDLGRKCLANKIHTGGTKNG